MGNWWDTNWELRCEKNFIVRLEILTLHSATRKFAVFQGIYLSIYFRAYLIYLIYDMHAGMEFYIFCPLKS